MLYSTKDLIERSKALADCSNTDFISDKEAEQMLNEAWFEVYQLSIDKGDDNFVKTLKCNHCKNVLPKDFYSLRAVKSPNGYMYKRRSLNATLNEPGYNIINGELIISGSLPTGAEITYYPMPKHLTFQFNEKQLDFGDPNADIFDNNSKYFVYWKHIEEGNEVIDKLIIYDMLNDTEVETVIDYEPNSIECSKSTFFVFGDDIYEYDYQGNMIAVQSASPNYGAIKTKTGLVKFAEFNGLSKKLVYDGHEYLLEFEEPLRTLERIIATSAHFYYIDNAGTLYEYNILEQEAIVLDTGVNEKFLKYKEVDKEDGVLYYKDCPMIFSRGFNRSEVLEEIRQPIDVDYSKFYGFTDGYVIFSDGFNMFCIGNLPDVIMNFPNSAFYTLIAYAMATRLIAKQGGDASTLSAQWAQAIQNYYDQSEDAYMPVRITNVYQ